MTQEDLDNALVRVRVSQKARLLVGATERANYDCGLAWQDVEYDSYTALYKLAQIDSTALLEYIADLESKLHA